MNLKDAVHTTKIRFSYYRYTTHIKTNWRKSGWTKLISNGTIMVVERYFHATIDEIPAYPNKLSALTYKVFQARIIL